MLFGTFFPFDATPQTAGRVAFVPSADLTVSHSDMVLTVDLPGLTAGDLDIEVIDGLLTIRGQRTRGEVPEGTQALLVERGFGPFERRVQLPRGVDLEAITASMDAGVLTLVVPKPEALKPKTIAVGSGAQERALETAAA